MPGETEENYEDRQSSVPSVFEPGECNDEGGIKMDLRELKLFWQ
jgi:hypothetical protein